MPDTPATTRSAITRWSRFALPLLAAVVTLATVPSQAAPKGGGKGYDYYLTGNAADVKVTLPVASTAVLMGGGTDVDAAFKWMIGKIPGGNFLVLRATGADGYNSYLYDMTGLSSVETLVIKTREAAADPAVLAIVNKADAIFVAGGDQKDYITLWKGTPLDAALNAAMTRKVPIGGTSAGLAVLGQFDFAALNGTIDSPSALANPYDRGVTLDKGFLTIAGLENTITDSHFVERDRMGRLVTFLARLIQDGWASWDVVRGIGVDSTAALLVESGSATLVGAGSAYFLRAYTTPAKCEPKKPLTFNNVGVRKLLPGQSFDLYQWTGPGAELSVSATAGVFAPPY